MQPAIELNPWAQVQPPASQEGHSSARSTCSLGFALFILLNATLFIRPAEVLPALLGLPIYEVLIGLCLITSWPVIQSRVRLQSLAAFPGSACVIALLPALILSHLSHLNFWGVKLAATDFSKTLLYYVLLVGHVHSPPRLRRFLVAVVVFILAIGTLSVLQYHEVINLEALSALERLEVEANEETGERDRFFQLRASGLFNDPNDFSLIIASAMLVSLHFLVDGKSLAARLLWVMPIALLVYPFMLTQSRGGLLSLLAGLMVYLWCRMGWRKATVVALVILPPLLVLLSGRQTAINISDRNDTAYGRVLLWREGLVLLRSSPVFGIGYRMYSEEVGHVAHNSFVHSFTELGLFGGTLFVGAFFLPAWAIWRSRPSCEPRPGGSLHAWRPCILALLVGYAVGLCSLSRGYYVPTYVILGVAGGYCWLLLADDKSAVQPLSGRLMLQTLAASAGCFIFFEIFVRAVT